MLFPCARNFTQIQLFNFGDLGNVYSAVLVCNWKTKFIPLDEV